MIKSASLLRGTRGLFESKQQSLTLDVPDDLPPCYVDPARIQQVLSRVP